MMVLIRNYEKLPAGILKTKVSLTGLTADWTNYIGFTEMASGAAGLILFGFIFSWIFGREYGDRTMKDLLALPVSRSSIALSKFAAASVWCLLLSVLIFTTSLILGLILRLPGWDPRILPRFAWIFFGSSVLGILCSTPAGFVASAGKGVLAGVGCVLFAMGLANLFANIGLGAWFPWSIPMLFTGAVSGEGASLHTASYVIVAITALAGIVGTLICWNFLDQTR
jgi:ABC-2 type transport system permease protein